MQKDNFVYFTQNCLFTLYFKKFLSNNFASLFTKCNSIQKNIVPAIIEQILEISPILDLL